MKTPAPGQPHPMAAEWRAFISHFAPLMAAELDRLAWLKAEIDKGGKVVSHLELERMLEAAAGPTERQLEQLSRLHAENSRLAAALAADHRFEQAPCPICEYNGEGYFQPDKHLCAAAYHAAQETRQRIATQNNADEAARQALAGRK